MFSSQKRDGVFTFNMQYRYLIKNVQLKSYIVHNCR